MVDDVRSDDSHYEISLTAGQAFSAFVLLLLSLAAAFAFGYVVGMGRSSQAKTATDGSVIVNEAFPAERAPDVEPPSQRVPRTELTPSQQRAEISQSTTDRIVEASEPVAPVPEPMVLEASTEPVLHVAQILSTHEGAAAESLAARLIEDGFTGAYVERVRSEGGLIYRVRVTYPSEAAARAAVPSLRSYTTREIWVTKK